MQNDPMKILYFAFGSNMCTVRMKQRIPSAKVVGPATLPHWILVCNKLGRDGSAKANIVRRHGAVVHGVLYKLNSNDLEILDQIEAGYQRKTLKVISSASTSARAEAYVGTRLTTNPLPFGWYKDLILSGAREHGLPESYLNFLDRLPVRASSPAC